MLQVNSDGSHMGGWLSGEGISGIHGKLLLELLCGFHLNLL